MPVLENLWIAHPAMLAAGTVLFVIGWLLRQWANRHSLTDMAADAAWEAVKARDASAIGRQIKGKIDDIRGTGGAVGQTTRAAGYAARHVLAQSVGIGGWVSLLIGLGLMAAGVFWK